ncbi:MAG TPA: dual specificity protein phosphatase [Candidatus Glassbacteria bacterium]|nr:dual specificity protein phosphatase [Candidatus Glassbacteria bacterium]
MNEIINNLHVGSVTDAQLALNEGGGAVLSIGAEFSKNDTQDEFFDNVYIPLKNKSGCNWKLISLWDGQQGNIVRYLEEAWKFIDDNIENGPVLVHCMAGKSRSASVAWSYMLYKGKDPLDAYWILKKNRPVVDPYPEFLREILAAFKYNKSRIEELLQQIKDLNGMMKK